jgi:hypothetical protein
MKYVSFIALMAVFTSGAAIADVFGTGEHQFEIEFVTITGDSGDLGPYRAGQAFHYYIFNGVNRDDYRIGIHEVTNDQWDKFSNSLDVPVTGYPSSGYLENSRRKSL